MVLLYFKNQINNKKFSIDVSETDTFGEIKSKIIKNIPYGAGIVSNPSEISLSYYLPNTNPAAWVPPIDLDDDTIISEGIINKSKQNPIAYTNTSFVTKGGGRKRRRRTKRRRTKRRRTKRKGSKKRSRRTRRRR